MLPFAAQFKSSVCLDQLIPNYNFEGIVTSKLQIEKSICFSIRA